MLEKIKQAHLKKLEQQQEQMEDPRQSEACLARFMRRNTRRKRSRRSRSGKRYHGTPRKGRYGKHPSLPPPRIRRGRRPNPLFPSGLYGKRHRRPSVTLYDETIVTESAPLNPNTSADASKMLRRMDEIRKRKAQIARQIGEGSGRIDSAAREKFFPIEEYVEPEPRRIVIPLTKPQKSVSRRDFRRPENGWTIRS